MRTVSSLLAVALLTVLPAARADSIFNFESTPAFTATPFAVTSNGITASFSTAIANSATVCATSGFFSSLSGNALTEDYCSPAAFSPIHVSFSQNLSSLSFNFATPGGPSPFYASVFENNTLIATDMFSDSIPPGYIVAEGVATVTGTFNSVTLELGFPPTSGSTNPFALDNLDAVASTPEPSSFVLLGTGILGLAGTLTRRTTKRK